MNEIDIFVISLRLFGIMCYVFVGNLGRIDLVCEYEYDLFIRPDTCNPRHRLWFNFVVENTRQDQVRTFKIQSEFRSRRLIDYCTRFQNVIFNIVNISNKNNLFKNGMTPLVKSTSRNTWYAKTTLISSLF